MTNKKECDIIAVMAETRSLKEMLFSESGWKVKIRKSVPKV